MIETIKKSTSERVFNNMKTAIKILAGDFYRFEEPFVYHDGKSVVGCLVLTDRILFMSHV